MPKSNTSKHLSSTSDSVILVVNFIQLFLKIITREEFIHVLNQRKINANQFFKEIRQHKCFEIVYYAIRMNQLGKHLPKLTQVLDKRVKRRKQHNDELWQEYTSLSEKLSALQIDHILYKGKAFSDKFYPGNFMRYSVDIDLGIELKDIPEAAAVLDELGYEAYKHKPEYDSLSQSRAYYIDFSFVKRDPQGKIMYNIELHWQAAHKVLEVPYIFDDLKNKGAIQLIEDSEVFAFPKIELAVLLVIHHGMVDVWGQLRHIVDLHYVIEKLNEQEMEAFVKRLKQLKLYTCFENGMTQLDILHNKQKPNKLWELILSGNMSKNWSEFPTKLWWHLKMRDSLSDRIKVLYSLAKFRLKFKQSTL